MLFLLFLRHCWPDATHQTHCEVLSNEHDQELDYVRNDRHRPLLERYGIVCGLVEAFDHAARTRSDPRERRVGASSEHKRPSEKDVEPGWADELAELRV